MSLYAEDQLEVGTNHVKSFSFLLERTHCFYLLAALIKQKQKIQSLTNQWRGHASHNQWSQRENITRGSPWPYKKASMEGCFQWS